MGDMSDWLDRAWEYEDPTEIWHDRHGSPHRISEMRSGHIQNCINMLERTNFDDRELYQTYNALKQELKKREDASRIGPTPK